jgi:hypothetical protein
LCDINGTTAELTRLNVECFCLIFVAWALSRTVTAADDITANPTQETGGQSQQPQNNSEINYQYIVGKRDLLLNTFPLSNKDVISFMDACQRIHWQLIRYRSKVFRVIVIH